MTERDGMRNTAPGALAELIEKLTDEGLVGAAAAGRILKRHASTIARWVLIGVRIDDGRQVRLEGFRCGGKIQTSKPALLRFLAAQQTEEPPASAAIETTAARSRADAEACKILDAAGIR